MTNSSRKAAFTIIPVIKSVSTLDTATRQVSALAELKR